MFSSLALLIKRTCFVECHKLFEIEIYLLHKNVITNNNVETCVVLVAAFSVRFMLSSSKLAAGDLRTAPFRVSTYAFRLASFSVNRRKQVKPRIFDFVSCNR